MLAFNLPRDNSVLEEPTEGPCVEARIARWITRCCVGIILGHLRVQICLQIGVWKVAFGRRTIICQALRWADGLGLRDLKSVALRVLSFIEQL